MLRYFYMSSEHRRPYKTAEEVFGLTDREKLWNKISNARFHEILTATPTTIHDVSVTYND